MLISDFIKTLEEYQDEYGNVQVLMRDEYGNEDDFDCFPADTYNPFKGDYEKVIILEM